MRSRVAISAVAVLAAGAAGTAGTAPTVATSADAAHSTQAVRALDPGDFQHPAANIYFPLRPGTVFRYRGSDERQHFTERLAVTHRKKTIQGVQTRVISDVLRRADGSLAEKTSDWYAADNKGNAWYFGENTATYKPNGQVESREGSWQAGVHGAVAGLIMPANPGPTDAYRQEYWRDHAEDQAWIVARHGHVVTPYGKLAHIVRSYEWSRLEKGVISVKFYAP